MTHKIKFYEIFKNSKTNMIIGRNINKNIPTF